MSAWDTMCDRCDGLCCRVYDIVDETTGKLVKKAWDKCWYLDISNRCRIYATRSRHPGYRNSCDMYDCLEAGPIVTIFARRIPLDHPQRISMISSLLETIRIRIEESPDDRATILQYAAELLNHTLIDQTLLLSVKIARVKIERWEKE